MASAALVGEWLSASLGLILVLAAAAIPVVSIGVFVVTRTVHSDRLGNRPPR